MSRLYPLLSGAIRLYLPLSTSIYLYLPLSTRIRLYPRQQAPPVVQLSLFPLTCRSHGERTRNDGRIARKLAKVA